LLPSAFRPTPVCDEATLRVRCQLSGDWHLWASLSIAISNALVDPRRRRDLTELTRRRPQIWISDVERLHDLLQTQGDAALRDAFERCRHEQAIGAEYLAGRLDDSTQAFPSIPVAGRPPSTPATRLPRGGQVEVADGARRAGAHRSTWTRPSTAIKSRPHRSRS
jgi:hypothetical protein